MSDRSYHEEEVLGKAYDGRLMRRLLGFLRPHKARVAASLGLVIAGAGLQLAGPYLTKIAIDDHIAHGDLVGLAQVAGLLVITMLAGSVVEYTELTLMQGTGQRVMYEIRMRLFTHLQKISLSYYDRTPVGRLMTRITNDVDVLNELFTSGVVAIFGDVFLLAGIVVVMFALNAELAVVSLSVVPLIFLVTLLFRARVRASYRDVRTRLARMNANLNENLTGMGTVQIMNREGRNYAEFSRINAEHRDSNLQSVTYYSIFYPVVELIGALATALLIWYGGRQVLWGGLTLGGLVAFLQYVQRFFRPIADISEKYNILQSAMASSERIFDLLDTPIELQPPERPRSPEAIRGAIAFEGVTFAYRGGEPVLREVRFEVAPGEKVAIVGATGAGKTTLINLLTRFYDVQEGRIAVDGIDVREWDPHALRRAVGVVLQDVFLFSGTIRENLRLGETSITDERIVAAAREVNADEFIRRLPGGYDAEVKERGATLSVGEKQLLSFARCLAFDPQILVLDEATSSVDTETEIKIQEALRRLMRGRTSLVIAHRLSTIQDVDRIVVLHKGQVREQGTHAELLALGGIYHRLYQLQYQVQERAGALATHRGVAE